MWQNHLLGILKCFDNQLIRDVDVALESRPICAWSQCDFRQTNWQQWLPVVTNQFWRLSKMDDLNAFEQMLLSSPCSLLQKNTASIFVDELREVVRSTLDRPDWRHYRLWNAPVVVSTSIESCQIKQSMRSSNDDWYLSGKTLELKVIGLHTDNTANLQVAW